MKEMMGCLALGLIILCSRPSSSIVSDVSANHSGANLSDHSPLFFLFHIICRPSLSSVSSTLPKINWSKVTSADVEIYCDMILQRLLPFPPEVIDCSTPDCSCHLETLNNYAQSLMSTVVSCSFQCLPCSTTTSSLTRVPWME